MLSPAVNMSPWTKQETIKLMKLGKEFEGRRWKEIAEKMGVSYMWCTRYCSDPQGYLLIVNM